MRPARASSSAPISRPKVLLTAAEPMTAEVLSLRQLLDGRYVFRLATFQRAYAWRPGNASRLVSDLQFAMQQDKRRRIYPLGRLMLAQSSGTRGVEVVDGHQRLVTLTMLFAVLRDLETDTARSELLHRLIVRDAAEAQATMLTIQTLPAKFFFEYVQRRGSTDLEPDVARDTLPETERNIIDNRDCIRSELLAAGMDDALRRQLADYVLDRCRVETVVVDNVDDAWDMIVTEQETRLAFSNADEAKSLILSVMPSADHAAAAHLWESCEAVLQPEDLFRLLGHIRAMTWRGRWHSARPVEVEIIERFNVASDGLAFLSNELLPHAMRLKSVRRGEIGDAKEQEQIKVHLDMMTWIDSHCWMPGMLLWLKVNGLSGADLLAFTRRLDCLVWMSKIAGVDPGVQETRLHRLLDEIEARTPINLMKSLDIEPKTREAAINNLRSSNFAAKHYSGSLLRRISVAMGSDPGAIARDKVTVEHILPRNPQKSRVWLDAFRTGEGYRAHHEKLGNVVLLSGRDNQMAGTASWAEKQSILKSSTFVLAEDAAKEAQWTPQTITRRTERLINILLQDFGLPRLSKGE